MAKKPVTEAGFYDGKFLQVGEYFDGKDGRVETDMRPADPVIPADTGDTVDHPARTVDIAAAVDAVPPVIPAAPGIVAPQHGGQPSGAAKPKK